jgi:hypothetical protein
VPVYHAPGRSSARFARIKAMPVLRFPVDVIMERVPLASRWADAKWQPSAVVPAGAPSAELDAAPGQPQLMHDGPEGAQWRFPGHAIELHRSEGEGYFLNLESPRPCVFVMWRPAEPAEPPAVVPVVVTVSYNEAARMMDAGEQVEPVALPPPVLAWMQPFVAEHYKPEPRRKVRRNDPFAEDAGRPPRGR